MKEKSYSLENVLQLLESTKIPGIQEESKNWNEFQQRLQEQKRKQIQIHIVRGVAALFVLFIGLATLIGLNQQTVVSARGQMVDCELPDGSSVKLNAESSISYNNVLWRLQRDLDLSGEALFEVKKGSKFRVKSELGVTEVLGTRFIVRERADNYYVVCFSGKVKVTGKGKKPEEVILKKDERVEFSEENIVQGVVTDVDGAWLNAGFYFKKESLDEVFAEIGRRYDFTIEGKIPEEKRYSGKFPKLNIEEVMQMICLPFGLRFSLDTVERKINVHDVSAP